MEIEELLKNYFNAEKQVKVLPAKRKLKNAVLFYVAEKIDNNRHYTEKEINQIINTWCLFNDAPLIRRELYNKKFVDRKQDCSSYWKEKVQPTLESLGLN